MTREEIIADERYHTCGRCRWGDLNDDFYPCNKCIHGIDKREDYWEYAESEEFVIRTNGDEEFVNGVQYVLEKIDDAPTVEAIPKADYEARLKDDMVAMLTEIQLEIRHFMYDVNPSSSESDYACNYMIDIIQQKINALRGEKDA